MDVMSANGMSTRPFKPSGSGALPARPRNRLSHTLIEDLTIAWERDGPDCLRIMAKEEPSKFAQLAFATLPRNVMVEVNNTLPGCLDPETWSLLLRVLDIIQKCVTIEADPASVFNVIETALRAHYAKQIEA
jgi:hypothetical protein